MSNIFSTLWNDAKDFFNGVATNVPAAQQALKDLQNAENSALAAIDPIADALINAGLKEVPIVGPLSEPIVDALANSLIGKLKARLLPAAQS
jgi:hypothetical protein